MNKQITLIQATLSAVTAALLLAVGVAQAAPQEAAIVKLPRVVVTGKAMTVAVLPRVVVTGLSLNTQVQRQLLASAQAVVHAL